MPKKQPKGIRYSHHTEWQYENHEGEWLSDGDTYDTLKRSRSSFHSTGKTRYREVNVLENLATGAKDFDYDEWIVKEAV